MSDIFAGIKVNCSSLDGADFKACQEDEVARRLESGQDHFVLSPTGPGTGWTAYSRNARPGVAKASVGAGLIVHFGDPAESPAKK